VILLRAPIIRNIAMSAVALLTAFGVLATEIPAGLLEIMSM
jgi:hypothetical protein